MFHFAILPPGRYDVTAAAQGMATRTSRGIELLVGGGYDVALLTYESFFNLTATRPEVLDSIGLVVVDEDRDNGPGSH